MRIPLQPRGRDDALAYFTATLPPADTPLRIAYGTRTGAVARIGGRTVAAFDREHREALLPADARARELALEVERHALPTNGLPSGPGLRWTLYTWLSHPAPERHITVEAIATDELAGGQPAVPLDPLPLWGHAHLDVAWLWTYAEAHRKAQRTFANAVALLERDPDFVFAQSQPQLFAFVQAEDPELFDRVRALAAARRFDPDLAALWVESDCNLPSGEALLRQMTHARRYCWSEFAIEPSIAWLPDSFGFANTLPTLLSHAGVRYFGTTKLQWNDTTRFPYAQFRWRGPDGSEVIGALIDGMEGGPNPHRIATARRRDEPLVAGYGDGGGGPTEQMLEDARGCGRWERPGVWFASLDAKRAQLPVHQDELYLEYHRGVYTTMHAVKRANAALERRLSHLEEAAAWCVGMHASERVVAAAREGLQEAWTVLLRNQFHDVLPGTSIAAVHRDALGEYAAAGALLDDVERMMAAVLPRGADREPAAFCVPQKKPSGWEFDNGNFFARIANDGSIAHLHLRDGSNLCDAANRLVLYDDRPSQWDAWNIDAGYERSGRPVETRLPALDGDTLVVPFRAGASSGHMRIQARAGAPFLEVDLAIDWRERHKLLRVENALAVRTDSATFGTPHGTIVRSALADTPQRRARYEVPGQRFAFARDGSGAGLAVLTLDTYGWNARVQDCVDEDGGHPGRVHLGHSLLRSPAWPDPAADTGTHHLRYALLPLDASMTVTHVERAWEAFACVARVKLFTSERGAPLVVACLPAESGRAVVLRVRECDGRRGPATVRCALRMREAEAVDACERAVARDLRLEGDALRFDLEPYELRSFRVSF